jgi:hypothetical protein
VQRQYTGTAGRIENAQVAVFLTYAARRGHALIDRALYLPKSWTNDADRCRTAGVPDGVHFATKPALATTMITRAIQAGVPAKWVAADEVYGADPLLRKTIREHQLGYALQVAANRRVPTQAGPMRVDELAATLPDSVWQRYTCGPGSKGPRYYDWAWLALLPEDDDEPGGEHHLLIRRTPGTGELAYLRCYSPHPVPLSTLVRVAGQRWRIEESFQSAKGLVGLDHHQVRRWTSWHRWTTLAMLAHAFLAVATAIERDHAPTPAGLIDLTVNEFRRLFDTLLLAGTHTIDTLLAWSRWRRRHQARARECHYRLGARTSMITNYGHRTSGRRGRHRPRSGGHRRRGPAPSGPFTSYSGNPIISARSTGDPVQNVGHADLVDTPDGRTVTVLLGVRPLGLARAFAPLGRETFITDVNWVDGWPHVEPVVSAPRVGPDFHADFSSPDVLDDPEWIAVRRRPAEVAALAATSGRLTITGEGADLANRRPQLLGRRQRHLSVTESTHVDAPEGTGGLAARHDEEHWFALVARGVGTKTVVTARAVLAHMQASWQVALPGHEVELRIEMTPPSDFAAGAVGEDQIRLTAGGDQDVLITELDGRYWSYETAKSFTGRVLGLFAVEGTVILSDFSYTDTSAKG